MKNLTMKSSTHRRLVDPWGCHFDLCQWEGRTPYPRGSNMAGRGRGPGSSSPRGCWRTSLRLRSILLLAAGGVQGEQHGCRLLLRNTGSGASPGEDQSQHQVGEGEQGGGVKLVHRTQLNRLWSLHSPGPLRWRCPRAPVPGTYQARFWSLRHQRPPLGDRVSGPCSLHSSQGPLQFLMLRLSKCLPAPAPHATMAPQAWHGSCRPRLWVWSQGVQLQGQMRSLSGWWMALGGCPVLSPYPPLKTLNWKVYRTPDLYIFF